MFVKPAEVVINGQPLRVRGPNGRVLRPEGEEVPNTQFWHRRVVQGDVRQIDRPAPVVSEAQPAGEHE